MKYLGFEISDTLNHSEHWTKRKSLATTSLMRLKTMGLISNQMHPVMKGQLYKTYIRPVLMYGLENVFLSQKLLNEIKRTEGNLIKTMLNIPTRCRTTSLIAALNITPSEMYMVYLKLEFYERLVNN